MAIATLSPLRCPTVEIGDALMVAENLAASRVTSFAVGLSGMGLALLLEIRGGGTAL